MEMVFVTIRIIVKIRLMPIKPIMTTLSIRQEGILLHNHDPMAAMILQLNRPGDPYMNREGVIFASSEDLWRAVRGLVL